MAMVVGVDVGGTFTDAVAEVDGRQVRGKAFSTGDVTGGIFAALAVLCEQLGMTEQELLTGTQRFVLGNTIVTNAIDEMKLADVGLITTFGFKDTLRIARSGRDIDVDPHNLRPYPHVVDRRNVREVKERVDVGGNVVVALDEAGVVEEIDALVASGVQAIAVCLLWSFRNPAHERRIGELVAERHPEIPYTLSCELTPVYREYERMVTTVLDAAVKPLVGRHFVELERQLSERGLAVRAQIMQIHGGFLSFEETAKAPINMFNSGPVGGVTGARLLGDRLGRDRLLTVDMGGTSLDAAAIIDGELRILPRARIGAFPTSLTVVDIESIGAGGGSIGWIDERGLMRVGPHSAGSAPGPACYGRGGESPTVTDAALILGLINPDYYLGGTVALDTGAARDAMAAKLGNPLGLDVEEAARGMYRLSVSQMANATRKITINRGHDPREFTMVSFGGAMGLCVGAIADEMGCVEIVVPQNASVFSAWGLMHADAVFTEVRTAPWDFGQPAATLEEAFAELEASATAWFEQEGVPLDQRELVREADMKFAGQIFEVMTRLPPEALTDADKPRIRERFIRDYEVEFGAGTAWIEAELLVINARIRAIGHTRSDGPSAVATTGTEAMTYERELVDPIDGVRKTVLVHRGFAVAGATAEGPCVLEEIDTTVFVPTGMSASVTAAGDVLLSRQRADDARRATTDVELAPTR
jgi:N-methylhydantoinase A